MGEVRQLLALGLEKNPSAMQAAGYRELAAHVHGEISLDNAVALIKTRTRQLAKRQLTWFRREPQLQWIEIGRDGTACGNGKTRPRYFSSTGENFGTLKMYDTQEPLRERALLIGLERPGHDKWAVKDSLEELRELAVSAGAEVLDLISQKRDTAAAATFIGSGKVGGTGRPMPRDGRQHCDF